MEYEIQKMKKPLSVNIEKHDPNYCPKKMKTSTKGMYKMARTCKGNTKFTPNENALMRKSKICYLYRQTKQKPASL